MQTKGRTSANSSRMHLSTRWTSFRSLLIYRSRPVYLPPLARGRVVMATPTSGGQATDPSRPPPTELNRSQFDTSLQLRALRVPAKKCQEYLKKLHGYGSGQGLDPRHNALLMMQFEGQWMTAVTHRSRILLNRLFVPTMFVYMAGDASCSTRSRTEEL